MSNLIDTIDAILPQTQCEACEYKGCRPYAEAMAVGEADIDRCAPGGVDVLQQLADILHRDPTPYLDTVQQNYRPPSEAVIDEDMCIGCKKCIDVCPTDAIVGTVKMMHTVIADECCGCELCVPACPMDCISLTQLVEGCRQTQQQKQQQWRQRYTARQQRLENQQRQSAQKHQQAKLTQTISAKDKKRAAIAAAIARVNAKRDNNESS